MRQRVRKAVFPVAGLGTRTLPATKAMPKEMLTVVDRPLIHYAMEEAKAAGIEQFYFVTGRAKNAIEDHFDVAFELEATLRGPRPQRVARRAEFLAAGARATSPLPGSSARWGSVTPSGAPATWSGTSRSRCCWSMI